MSQIAIKLKGRIDAMYRYLVLNYQYGVVSRAVDALATTERRQLLDLTNRRTQSVAHDATATAEAFSRMRSPNSQLRMHALANWIGATYLETRDSPDGDLQDLHRRLLKTLRTLRESAPAVANAAPRAA